MPGEDREKRIRELAYAIWQQEGRPEGRAEEHWRMAETAVEAMERAEVEITLQTDGVPKDKRPFPDTRAPPTS